VASPEKFRTRDDVETSDLISTGRAAAILGTSRQHVIDLCERGDLPFTKTGVHRRVSRREVEALAARGRRLTRDQRRSLWLNQAVAGKLVQNPESVIGQARRNLGTLQKKHTRGQAARALSEWDKVLGRPVEEILDVLVSPTPYARELRQNSPFAGVLDDDERTNVLEAFSDYTKRSAR
jgi:excisionase family DNA binding protein